MKAGARQLWFWTSAGPHASVPQRNQEAAPPVRVHTLVSNTALSCLVHFILAFLRREATPKYFSASGPGSQGDHMALGFRGHSSVQSPRAQGEAATNLSMLTWTFWGERARGTSSALEPTGRPASRWQDVLRVQPEDWAFLGNWSFSLQKTGEPPKGKDLCTHSFPRGRLTRWVEAVKRPQESRCD